MVRQVDRQTNVYWDLASYLPEKTGLDWDWTGKIVKGEEGGGGGGEGEWRTLISFSRGEHLSTLSSRGIQTGEHGTQINNTIRNPCLPSAL